MWKGSYPLDAWVFYVSCFWKYSNVQRMQSPIYSKFAVECDWNRKISQVRTQLVFFQKNGDWSLSSVSCRYHCDPTNALQVTGPESSELIFTYVGLPMLTFISVAKNLIFGVQSFWVGKIASFRSLLFVIDVKKIQTCHAFWDNKNTKAHPSNPVTKGFAALA